MKDSGIEWIASMPADWELRPLKYILLERNQKNNPVFTEEVLSLSIDKGVTLFAEKTTNKDRFKEDLTQYKVAYPNDIVLNSMNVIVGAVGKSQYLGCVSPVYYIFYSGETNKYCIDYFDYIFKSSPLRKVLFSLGRGIMSIEKENDRINTCRLKVSIGDLKRLHFPVPPFLIQQQITHFLDAKCADIDNLLALQEKMISELKAYKQSFIIEAVTKGIDPSVPMKDSGIENIGLIPASWGVTKLKNLVYIKNGNAVLSSNKSNDVCKIPVYGSGGAFENTFAELSKGASVLLGRKGTINRPIWIEEGISFWCVDTAFYTTPKDICKLKYFYYCTLTINYDKYIYGTALPSMTQTILNNIFLPLPSLVDQNAIALYLDKKCNEIDNIISIKLKKIDQLKEYKKSIIYEYITGKKEVPN